MALADGDADRSGESIRTSPGVAIVALATLTWLGFPVLFPRIRVFAALALPAGGVAVLVWWIFFSRVPRLERWGAVALIVAGVALARSLLHESVAVAGMGFTFPVYVAGALALALVAWALVARHLPLAPRRLALVGTILLACGAWTLVRIDGVTGEGKAIFSWRWAETAEERLLARVGAEGPGLAAPPADAGAPAVWPGFRGERRDGIVRGVGVDVDWASSPPVELWRRPVGPGWSSFAVRGGVLYTQEQRGDDEVVSCYRVATGEPVWMHRDATRFWDPEGGAGPRATPSVAGDRVYSFGATGILNALDARDGSLLWSRDAASDTGAGVPQYGFASSPLVTGDLVLVDAGGLVAYDRADGQRRWLRRTGPVSYSSPQLVTIDGVRQVVLASESGVTGVAPADGAVLWEHRWRATKIVQPAVTAEGDLLAGTWMGDGTRRIALDRGPGGWSAREIWTSHRLKPDFSGFVVHGAHAYGFDGSILTSIDLEDGQPEWKGGRYGHGQLLLLADQDLLLVVTERGDLALVEASPAQFTELAMAPGIEGKTWNHPALAGDLLLVRNDREMAAFRLPMERH